MNSIVRKVTAVTASVGELNGWARKLSVFVTAVVPKLVPSFHASVCTRNHTPHSPVWKPR